MTKKEDLRTKRIKIAVNLIDEIMSINHSDLTEEDNTEERLFFWRGDNGTKHLKDRKKEGHLPQNATLEDYENIIEQVLTDNDMVISINTEKTDRYAFGSYNVNGGERWIAVLDENRYAITCYKTYTDDNFYSMFGKSGTYHRIGTYLELSEKLNEEVE